MTPELSEATPFLLPIGWKERLDFPDWGLKRVRVKIDTGACTSALGATSYELVDVDGRPMVRLRLALNRRYPKKTTIVEAPVVRMVYVTNTGGGREERPMIETTMMTATQPLRGALPEPVTGPGSATGAGASGGGGAVSPLGSTSVRSIAGGPGVSTSVGASTA